MVKIQNRWQAEDGPENTDERLSEDVITVKENEYIP